MGEYSRYIHPQRRCVPAPKDMVENGRCAFGTFDREFQTMNLTEIDHPTTGPNFMNKLKLTLWEAAEFHVEKGVLLVACSDMGLFSTVLHVFYNKETKQVSSWMTKMLPGNVTISPNLLDGARSTGKGKNLSITFVNDFGNGKCTVSGYHYGKDGCLKYEMEMTRLSQPCVVSIPFAEPNERHMPLYSQKDFFKIRGEISVNGQVYPTDETSTGIVDDHRGYYPRHAHYDWCTTMGVCRQDGKQQFLAFNLTRNQSIDQERFNENLLWLEGRTSLLPPVTFEKSVPTAKSGGKALWKIRDAHDMVHVDFQQCNMHSILLHAKPLLYTDYFIPFGALSGYVRDEDGTKYCLDGMMGMGEDKTIIF